MIVIYGVSAPLEMAEISWVSLAFFPFFQWSSCTFDNWCVYKVPPLWVNPPPPRRKHDDRWKIHQEGGWMYFSYILPWRLTWNIIMEVWKIIFLSKWVICRFHVNLPGCSHVGKLGGCILQAETEFQGRWAAGGGYRTSFWPVYGGGKKPLGVFRRDFIFLWQKRWGKFLF